MLKLGSTLLLIAAILLPLSGCDEDEAPKPSVSRLYASESCGVAPMRVAFRAEATGGELFDDPTGGNSWLKLSWDFGDGTVIEDGESIAYHRYETSDEYLVTVTVEDARGERFQRSLTVTVNPDSLLVTPFAVAGNDTLGEEFSVTACQPLLLGFQVETCGFDPRTDSYDRFVSRWTVDGQPLARPDQPLIFVPQEGGDRQDQDPAHLIDLAVEDPGQMIVRHATLRVADVRFEAQDEAHLSLSADWALSNHPDDDGTETLALSELPPADLFPPNGNGVTYTYTIRARNDGPAPAYNLAVDGSLPALSVYPNAILEEAIVSGGDLSYDAATKQWAWDIPLLEADTEMTLDITFRNSRRPPPNGAWPTVLSFPATMTRYPCDPSPEAPSVEARLTR